MLSTCLIALNFDQTLASFDLWRHVLLVLFQGSAYPAES